MVRWAAKTCRWCRPRRPAPRAAPAPRPQSQAEARRDYELALQIGNRNALKRSYAYPDGFYASLAKLQLEKIAAEETRITATEKARLAEQERARLAAEGAQKIAQAKAEAEPRPPSRLASPPKRPSRSRRIRPLRPNRNASRPKYPHPTRLLPQAGPTRTRP